MWEVSNNKVLHCMSEEVYTCKYCEKSFKRESTLAVHMCEPKKRHRERNEKGVQLGMQAYLKFYEYTQGSAKTKTYDDFAKSPYYKAFVKFGRYCVSINAINIPRFINYVIQNNKKLDYWASDKIYTEYLEDLLYKENATDALARAIEFSIKWGEEHNALPCDVVRHGNDNATCYNITTGKISAWVLYNSVSGQQFLGRISEEQRRLIWDYINPEKWAKILEKYPADQEYVHSILDQAGW